MNAVTNESVKELLREQFGEVEPMVDDLAFVGSKSVVPLGQIGIVCVYQKRDGTRIAIPVPFGVTFPVETAA